jgi:thiol:disulfide interchange protein DsbG
MNRRYFLLSFASILLAKKTYAEALIRGPSAKASGQRSHTLWNHAVKRQGLRLAGIDEQVQIIFFFDPNCPFCQKLWHWFNTYEEASIASLWIPVAYVGKTSTGKAISMLRATNPKKTLQKNYKTFDFSNKLGGITVAQSPTEKEKTIIRNNSRFWSKALFGTTPLIMYRKNDGTYWHELGFTASRMEKIMSVLGSP